MNLSKKKVFRVLSVFLIHCISSGWVIVYFKNLYQKGKLLSAANASQYMTDIILQSVIVCLPGIIVGVIALCCWKKESFHVLFLKIEKNKTKKVVLFLVLFYIISLMRQLLVYDDAGNVLFKWVYFLLFIAFYEEFEYRALMPAILNGYVSPVAEWLLPNLLFAAAHIAIPIVKGAGLSEVVMLFLSGVFGYVLLGCLFEWCKRKSSSLWVGVLIHAIMDFGY